MLYIYIHVYVYTYNRVVFALNLQVLGGMIVKVSALQFGNFEGSAAAWHAGFGGPSPKP